MSLAICMITSSVLWFPTRVIGGTIASKLPMNDTYDVLLWLNAYIKRRLASMMSAPSVSHSYRPIGPWHTLKKPAPEIGAVGLNSTPADSDINPTPDSGAIFHVDTRLLTSLTVNDVRSRALARKTGAGIWRGIYGADFWSRFLERVSGDLTFAIASTVTWLCQCQSHDMTVTWSATLVLYRQTGSSVVVRRRSLYACGTLECHTQTHTRCLYVRKTAAKFFMSVHHTAVTAALYPPGKNCVHTASVCRSLWLYA